MADHDALQRHVQSLKPGHIECKEGILCIAIIPHNRSVQNTFAPTDLMWVKCPRTRGVKVLLDAYRQKYNPTTPHFHLTHEGQRIEPFDSVEILEDGEKVVVLRAIDAQTPSWEQEQTIEPEVSPSQAKSSSTPGRSIGALPKPNATSQNSSNSSSLRSENYEESEDDIEDMGTELEPEEFAASLQTSESIADEAVTTKFNINELFSQASILEYEKGVVKGLGILGNLRKALSATSGPDAEQWLASIAKL